MTIKQTKLRLKLLEGEEMMDENNLIFTVSIINVFISVNVLLGLCKILIKGKDFINPTTNTRDEIKWYVLLAFFIFMLSVLGFGFIGTKDGFTAITLSVMCTALSSLLLKKKPFFPFEVAAKYLLLLPAKTIVKVLIVCPFKFLKTRKWGQTFLWLFLIVCLTWATYFLFDIKFLSRNSVLLLLAVISVVGAVLVFRSSYKNQEQKNKEISTV